MSSEPTRLDNPNQQVVRPDGSGPGDDGSAGESKGKQAAEPEKLPGTHAALDSVAFERGHEWSADDLTVAEKQAELSG